MEACGAAESLLANLDRLRAEGLLCDVVLAAGEERLAAHQVLLAASNRSLCDYFVAEARTGDKGDEQVTPWLTTSPQPLELQLQGSTPQPKAVQTMLAHVYGSDRPGSSVGPAAEEARGGAAELAAGLRALRTEGLLCDVVFVVGKERLVAHQVVIAAASANLRKYIAENLDDFPDHSNVGDDIKSAGDGSATSVQAHKELLGKAPQPIEIDLQAISSPEAVQAVLNHMYGAPMPVAGLPAEEGTIRDILRLAADFGLSQLRDRACRWLEQAGPPAKEGGLRETLRLAVDFALPTLRDHACQWLLDGVSAENLAERLAACDEFGFSAMRKHVANKLAAVDSDLPSPILPEMPSPRVGAASGAEVPVPSPDSSQESRDGSVDASREEELERSLQALRTVKFAGGPVPQAWAEDEDLEAHVPLSRSQDAKIFGHLRMMFEHRPIWLQGALENELSSRLEEATLMRMLPLVAYQWTDGPWNNSYTRLGWDPRENAHAAKLLQVLEFKDPYFRRPENQSKKILEADIGDTQFRRPPVYRCQSYQLLDINDEYVQELVHGTDAELECTKKAGWLPEFILEAVRTRLTIKASQMREKREAKEQREKAARRKQRADERAAAAAAEERAAKRKRAARAAARAASR